jgi:glycerol-3-phosphate dehydrogenase (NAD(P)+)
VTVIDSIGVIGGGAWGTALAMAARRSGNGDVTLWAREAEVVEGINRQHRNAIFLPGIAIDPGIRATAKLADVAAADALLMVAPAQYARQVCAELAPHVAANKPIVICSKGIEQKTGALLSEAVGWALPKARLAILSGPTFAEEVAKGLPAAVTLAVADEALGHELVARLGYAKFRTYLSHDLVGAQIGGAVKNVLAIACGIVEGMGLGRNARAALIARGLVEMIRLGQSLGAHFETMIGLSGLGDLVLTCTSEQSRNASLGMELGKGRALADILGERRSVAEGVATARAIAELAGRHGVDMPIAAAVDEVLHGGVPVATAIERLLARPIGEEKVI